MAARVAVTLPGAGAVGQPIQPSGIRLSLTVPAATGIASGSTASAQLTVVPAIAGIGARTTWTFPATPTTTAVPPATGESAPPSGDIGWEANGKAQPVTSAVPGRLSFVATQLTLTFSSAGAKDTQVMCTTTDDSGTQLASLPVAATQNSAGSGISRLPGGPLKVGAAGTHKSAAGRLDDEPNSTPASAYLVGYSDVQKLNGAALVGPGLIDLKIFDATFDPVTGDVDVVANGQLTLPPAKSTFLTFGFMPTAATMQLTQVGIMVIKTHSAAQPDGTYITTTVSTVQMSLRIYEVKVNGTSLDVGPNCHTFENLFLTLNAEGDYAADTGGTFAGTVTIPRFADCGVGEDLDGLFTASISGPGNFMRMTQGPGCFPVPVPYQCPPVIPEPKR
ncbi:hypothetical protein GCM10009765_36470 [Fodinicola feengrottensis]|uniref:Ig-like domain-containing protein n=1 Tax=Fodinicola feengrottensis TaxID=435914 RepID=A0ABN2H8W4_9ACTN